MLSSCCPTPHISPTSVPPEYILPTLMLLVVGIVLCYTFKPLSVTRAKKICFLFFDHDVRLCILWSTLQNFPMTRLHVYDSTRGLPYPLSLPIDRGHQNRAGQSRFPYSSAVEGIPNVNSARLSASSTLMRWSRVSLPQRWQEIKNEEVFV